MEAIASTHFSERQEKYSQDLLEAVRKELDTIEIPKPLLSPQEVKDRDNFLLIHKYARNAFRLSFSIRVPEIGVEDPNKRIAEFDRLMNELEEETREVGDKPFVYNQIPNEAALHQMRGYSSWEFLGVTDESRNEETTNQATILEICEMISKKIGVELDL